ncbi:MAG: alpha/beta fold hydrolase [Acidimicrobiales bacterium]|nr:alpha/beta fold hydrolase [Acidimicrobiales bacterium]
MRGTFAGLVLSLLAGVIFVPSVATADGAASPPHYPVVWSFLTTAVVAGAENGPDVPPPGSNVPCAPSALHPDPVILVHGLGGDQNDNWQTLSPFLADQGYCVFSLTYGNMASSPRPFDEIGGLAPMEASAQRLAAFVDFVLGATNAQKVDIVGHSEGGTMPDYYLKFLGGAQKVARFVMLSGVPHGTTFWGLSDLYDLGAAYGYGAQANALSSFCASCSEFLVGSSFMQALDAPNAEATPAEAATCPYDGAAVDGVSYTSIATEYDELVRPYDSDFMDPRCATTGGGIGVDNVTVQQQCPTDLADHLSITADQVAAHDVLNALDPAHAQPVRCTLTLPAVG